jgi:hypothetical protein
LSRPGDTGMTEEGMTNSIPSEAEQQLDMLMRALFIFLLQLFPILFYDLVLEGYTGRQHKRHRCFAKNI